MIPLAWTYPNLGGRRAWFTCLSCDRRAGRVFLSGTRFVCRRCAGARYRSQALRTPKYLRRLERAGEIRSLLGGRPGLLEPFPARPKGMQATTYGRLREEALAIEQAELDAAVERQEISHGDALAISLIHGIQALSAARSRPG